MANKTTDYKRQFNADNYDRLEIRVPKGKKALIKDHSTVKGESLNSFVNRAIDETIDRDKEQEGSD